MYTKDAIYYDLLNEKLQYKDIEFYQKILLKGDENVCELACGTGRILFSLNNSLRALTGIDISTDMLNIAKKKANEYGILCNLLCQDMCNLSHKGNYDTVICGYNSVQHILTEKELFGFFFGVLNLLSDDGTFVVDLFQSCDKYLFPLGNETEIAKLDYMGDEITVAEYSQYDAKSSINHIVYKYFNNGELIHSELYNMKQYEAKYLDNVIEQSGFRIADKYGDYDFSVFNDSSPKQIYLLKKR